MTAVVPPKVINLNQLEQELHTAGVQIRGLGARGRMGEDAVYEVFTYHGADAVDVPPEALPIIAAHVAQPTEGASSGSDLAANVITAMARLDQIISASTFTQVQLGAAVQDIARIQRRVLRYIASNVLPRA